MRVRCFTWFITAVVAVSLCLHVFHSDFVLSESCENVLTECFRCQQAEQKSSHSTAVRHEGVIALISFHFCSSKASTCNNTLYTNTQLSFQKESNGWMSLGTGKSSLLWNTMGVFVFNTRADGRSPSSVMFIEFVGTLWCLTWKFSVLFQVVFSHVTPFYLRGWQMRGAHLIWGSRFKLLSVFVDTRDVAVNVIY